MQYEVFAEGTQKIVLGKYLTLEDRAPLNPVHDSGQMVDQAVSSVRCTEEPLKKEKRAQKTDHQGVQVQGDSGNCAGSNQKQQGQEKERMSCYYRNVIEGLDQR